MPDQAFLFFENEFLASFSRLPIYSLVQPCQSLMKTHLFYRQNLRLLSRFEVQFLEFDPFLPSSWVLSSRKEEQQFSVVAVQLKVGSSVKRPN